MPSRGRVPAIPRPSAGFLTRGEAALAFGALRHRFDDGFRQRKESRANWQSTLLRKFVSNFYATMMPFINPSEHLVDIRYAERKTALFRHVVEAYKVMPIWLFSETPFRHSTFNQKSL